MQQETPRMGSRTLPPWLLSGLNDMMYIMCLAQCLAHKKVLSNLQLLFRKKYSYLSSLPGIGEMFHFLILGGLLLTLSFLERLMFLVTSSLNEIKWKAFGRVWHKAVAQETSKIPAWMLRNVPTSSSSSHLSSLPRNHSTWVDLPDPQTPQELTISFQFLCILVDMAPPLIREWLTDVKSEMVLNKWWAYLCAFRDLHSVQEVPDLLAQPAMARRGRFQPCTKDTFGDKLGSHKGPFFKNLAFCCQQGLICDAGLKYGFCEKSEDFKAITFLHEWKSRIMTFLSVSKMETECWIGKQKMHHDLSIQQARCMGAGCIAQLIRRWQ